MLRVDTAKWGQSLEDLRQASLSAPHRRTRERFQALYLLASGQFNGVESCPAGEIKRLAGRLGVKRPLRWPGGPRADDPDTRGRPHPRPRPARPDAAARSPRLPPGPTSSLTA